MRKNDTAYYLALITQLGLTIIVSILVSLFIGMFLDRVFNIKGVFLVLFLVIGVSGGFYNAYKQILKK